MNDLMQLYFSLIKNAKDLGDGLAQELSIAHHEQPAGFYGMAFNSITLTTELLSYYNDLWGKISSIEGMTAEDARQQNAQRVIMIQKMSYIQLMSEFEFTAKNIFLSRSDIFGAPKGRVYISKIMDSSLQKGLISNETHNLWEGAIFFRNSLTHNNGICEETALYKFPDCELRMVENEMVKGDLKLFGYLTRWVLQASSEWIRAVQ